MGFLSWKWSWQWKPNQSLPDLTLLFWQGPLIVSQVIGLNIVDLPRSCLHPVYFTGQLSERQCLDYNSVR